jgi:anaerobic selenocysteine-containing dehydrogenase
VSLAGVTRPAGSTQTSARSVSSERLVKGRERCTLLMHPEDARARGLCDAQPVRIASRVGAVVAPLEVSDAMRPGVVCLPHGWGHARPGARLSVAGARPGVSFNDLSDESLVDPLCGTARLNDVPVEVTAIPRGPERD